MKRQIAVFCAAIMLGMTVFPLEAVVASESADTSSTTQSIINKEMEKAQTEAELQNAENAKETLEQQKIQLEGYLGELNTKLQELSVNIEQLEQQIGTKNQEIATIQANLEEAKLDESKQYEDMKKRIQYMYEQGNMSLFSILMSGKGLPDMITRTEYIARISKFDRDMLVKYRETKDLIADNEVALVTEKKGLSTLEADLMKQQEELVQTLMATQENLLKNQTQIAAAEQQIQSFEQELVAQQEQLDNLMAIQEAEAIAQNAAEVAEAAKKAQDIADSLGDKMDELGISTTITPTYGEPYKGTASDLVLLATIIYCEAGAEPFEGKCAVGACVINRVRSFEFPNTILGVIYDPGQFTPVTTGRFALALAQGVPDECYQAAQMAMNGYNNIGDYLYFRTPNGRVQGLQIGGHIFHDGRVF